jgi:hypothetical protein
LPPAAAGATARHPAGNVAVRASSWGSPPSPAAGRRSHRRRAVRPPARRATRAILGPTRFRLYRGRARPARPPSAPPTTRGGAAAGGRRLGETKRAAGRVVHGGRGPPAPTLRFTPGRPPTRAGDSCSRALPVLDGRRTERQLSAAGRPSGQTWRSATGPARIPRAGDDEVGAGWKRKTTGPQLKSYSTSVKLSNRKPTIAPLVARQAPPELRPTSSAAPPSSGRAAACGWRT